MITVIFPVYNEEQNLVILHKRLASVADKLKGSFEFIFIDDCSTDQTPEILRQLHAIDPRVKTIRFARNCGSHAALRAGLENAKGDCVITLASDLQDPPEVIPTLLEEWKNGKKIVWGARQKREGETFITKFFSRRYYGLMNWLTNVKMPPSGADIFLADRAVVEAFRYMSEKHTSVFMALAWLGFKQSTIYYVKEARQFGVSKWTIRRKIKLTVDSLLSFSDVFIRSISTLGFITALLGFIYALYVLYCHLRGSPVEGWSSLMIAILVIGGIQMTMLGLLGEYLWRTFDESRKRPAYIIEYKIE
jgi:glycosyltransferase involved in cell wall biosynthesis